MGTQIGDSRSMGIVVRSCVHLVTTARAADNRTRAAYGGTTAVDRVQPHVTAPPRTAPAVLRPSSSLPRFFKVQPASAGPISSPPRHRRASSKPKRGLRVSVERSRSVHVAAGASGVRAATSTDIAIEPDGQPGSAGNALATATAEPIRASVAARAAASAMGEMGVMGNDADHWESHSGSGSDHSMDCASTHADHQGEVAQGKGLPADGAEVRLQVGESSDLGLSHDGASMKIAPTMEQISAALHHSVPCRESPVDSDPLADRTAPNSGSALRPRWSSISSPAEAAGEQVSTSRYGRSSSAVAALPNIPTAAGEPQCCGGPFVRCRWLPQGRFAASANARRSSSSAEGPLSRVRLFTEPSIATEVVWPSQRVLVGTAAVQLSE